MSLSDCSEKVPSSVSDELQFPMDDYQAISGASTAEKSASSIPSVQQNDTTDEIWRSINNNRDCLPKNRDDTREGLERATSLKCALGDEEQVVVLTIEHDSSKHLQSAPESPDGGGQDVESDKEKAGRGSLENKTTLKPSPSVGTSLVLLVPEASNAKSNGSEACSSSMMEEAWERLRCSFVYFQKKPVGTLAAVDPSAEDLNYNQVFVRDFVPTALACLMKIPDPEPEIVKNFLLKTLHLQGWKKTIDNFTLGEGVMPASFKVMYDSFQEKDVLKADFGGSAIGRVAPVDSGFWWIILLRSYTKCTGDYTLSEEPEVQKGMKLILDLCLSDGFDTYPTLLCADGCSMIDRRMGIYGYPIEIQALFFFALRCAQQMLKEDTDSNKLIERIERRITALSYHIRKYYWLDFTQLNNIYRYKTEEYSHTAVNKFNVIPESIPDWVFDFMPLRGGYFIGNVSPARMDFRWFLVDNCIAILSSLATMSQTTAIMDLVEERWEDLIGEMPLKIAYPALEGYEWNIVTGCDPKNTRWSYHNGGSWPVLLWLLTAACIKAGRPQIAKRAIELMEQRLSKDGWPEYYDGKKGRYVGKQARKHQTWSISGYLVAKLMIENPSNLAMISLEEDKKIEKPRLTRSASWTCSSFDILDPIHQFLWTGDCKLENNTSLPDVTNRLYEGLKSDEI
ncbi:hypothetical protein L1987_72081 [Smallanthus sonchifolius]|uniref:Uncharacterized protein n=1 Tax=Smallanthus sonchifolius TaxID=185202 RepID=A0ACB9AUL0_9ASTR|nr:hypothetical protein L1987_72081 [Smallanthus sonchifolius]